MNQETDEAIAQAKGWKFSTKDLGLPNIEDEAGCREFFMLLYTRFGLVWHPDTDFEEYVDLETGRQRVFSPRACDLMDGAMAKCFEILGERVYDVALETDQKWRDTISCDNLWQARSSRQYLDWP